MKPPAEPEPERYKLLYRQSDEPLDTEPPAEPERDTLPWPDSTFVPDGDDSEHFQGSHYDFFVDDNIEIIKRIPEILPNVLVQTGYGEVYKSSKVIPGDWPIGFQLVWPIRNHGLALILSIEKEANNIASLFPFFHSVSQHAMTLREVRVWKGGLEAQITATLGDGEVTFFDTQYLINRAWYEADKNYEFILSGIAYTARPAANQKIKIDPDVVKKANQRMKELKEEEGFEAYEMSDTLTLEGAAILLPISKWDADDYNFHAPVKSVKEFKDWLGQDGWQVRATVMRRLDGGDDEDIDLDIIITRRVWLDKAPPQVGQDIEGNLWLQGYLWRHLE